jgi:hypothetical protein
VVVNERWNRLAYGYYVGELPGQKERPAEKHVMLSTTIPVSTTIPLSINFL